MAGKRKLRRAMQAEDLSKPSSWRRQHGRFGAAVHEADPDTGTPVQHRRAVDTLGLMLEHGTITPEMHEAGGMFRTQFRTAALDGMRTTQLVRTARGTGDTMTERHVGARHRIAAAIEAVGGVGSPGGSCLWHVVGLECSIREWAMQQGWNGKPIVPAHGQGILVGALGTLVLHYRLAPRQRGLADGTLGVVRRSEAVADAV